MEKGSREGKGRSSGLQGQEWVRKMGAPRTLAGLSPELPILPTELESQAGASRREILSWVC